MGIFGIVSLYFFLIYIVIKRWKDARIISIVMVSYIVCGYFYDISICDVLLAFIYRICFA